MRRLIAFDRVSADGYFSTDDGRLDWTVPEEALDRAAVANMTGPGMLLFGRRTYEMFESFWPNVLHEDATAPDPHTPDRRSPELLAMARWLDEATKIVVSSSRADVTWRNSRLVRSLDEETIAGLKSEEGPDIMIFGSGTVVSQLTACGLVDEYQLIVGPVLLGAGKPLVSNVATHTRLTLLEATSYPSGNVKLRWGLAR